MFYVFFQRPAIISQTLILQTLSSYVKTVLLINQTLNHAFSLLHVTKTKLCYCRVQKHNAWICRNPQLCYDKVLLINIYLKKKKSICSFKPHWSIYLKLEVSCIWWSKIKVFTKALTHIVAISDFSLFGDSLCKSSIIVQKIVCTQAQESCCIVKEHRNTHWQ